MFHPNGPTFFELARQALSSTEKGYDLLAPKFDFTPFRTADLFFEAFLAHLESEQAGGFDAVLDVCCGTGAAMQAVASVANHRIVGVDMSQGMLEQARQNLADVELTPELIRGNAYELPFDDEFDLAVSFGAFGHVLPKDEQLFVDQIFKSLKSGGTFAFVTHEMPSILTAAYWMARGFNGAMRIRNLLIRPPFIMYYLTFLWPDIRTKLEQAGFAVAAKPLFADQPKLAIYQYVTAKKP